MAPVPRETTGNATEPRLSDAGVKRPRSSSAESDKTETQPDKKVRPKIIELEFEKFHCHPNGLLKKLLNASVSNGVKGSVDHDDKGSDSDEDDEDDKIGRCVIKPKHNSTTFDDVHVSKDALEALDVLLLSNQDPNAFEVGILANSPHQGVLLYGPPGTGKTHLVRALANQGHATLLSLTGADIKSRFVGEGEKKIQQIFRYARKHHPCIIFIDEADALFRSRSAESTCRSHVECINQFLGEMDGMESNSASSPMVIAATNRPFDIDEGILRRLGRRVMVDIPDEEARDKIVGDLLKDELVSIEADIPGLVRQTHGYTGSDLRALVRQAALTAVREIQQCKRAGRPIPGMIIETADGSEHRRVLRKLHFIRAMHEIRASPNKESVAKIRDFHNKFGNTAQRFELDDERPEVINMGKGQVHV